MMGRGNISKDRKILGEVVGGGLNFDAGCDLLRIARSCKQLPFKSGCPWGPTFL